MATMVSAAIENAKHSVNDAASFRRELFRLKLGSCSCILVAGQEAPTLGEDSPLAGDAARFDNGSAEGPETPKATPRSCKGFKDATFANGTSGSSITGTPTFLSQGSRSPANSSNQAPAEVVGGTDAAFAARKNFMQPTAKPLRPSVEAGPRPAEAPGPPEAIDGNAHVSPSAASGGHRHRTRPPARPAAEDSKLTSTVPPLGPVGCGGWFAEAELTEEMRQVRAQAIELLEQEDVHPSQYHLEFLTAATLGNYVDPLAPHHLVTALKRRIQVEEVLTAKKAIYQNSSIRVIGWDGNGTAVISQECSTMRASMGYALEQIEYVVWTSMDLNKPGTNGFVAIMDFGGGISTRYFLDPRPVIELASMVEGQWRRRLKVAYLVDIPRSFERFITFFLGILKQSTREKVRFIGTVDELIVELERSGCDEETLATARSALESRRKSGAKQTWFPLVDHSFFRETLADLHLSQDLESFTEVHHRRFRDAISAFRIKRWGNRFSAADVGDSKLPVPSVTTTRSSSSMSLDVCSTGTPVIKLSAQDPIKLTATQCPPESGVKIVQEVAPSASQEPQFNASTGRPEAVEIKRLRGRSRLASLARCLVCGACGA
mmetsp:Transcript_27548/g.53985  ORF Transcript_27548/g.53985 Transcript_27548/m.53985 type:complete len:604 (-) Transcript_27548:112-1923(-)